MKLYRNGTNVPTGRDNTYDGTEVRRKSIEELFETSFNADQKKALLGMDIGGGGSVDIEVDPTLTQEGMAADAKAAGDAINDAISATAAMVGSPLVASTAAGMTDQNKVYVYTGSESGYTAGNWYYWNGSAWTSGGVYNSSTITTDATLTQSGQAADAKAAGDKIAAVNSYLSNTPNLINVLNTTKTQYGVTLKGYHDTCTITISGEATSSGDGGKNLTLNSALPAGTYYLQAFGRVGAVNFKVYHSNGSNQVVYNGGSFTTTEEADVKIAIQLVNGTVYNETIQLQLVKGSKALSKFVPLKTMTDEVARLEIDKTNANVTALTSDMSDLQDDMSDLQDEMFDKLSSEFYYGIGQLPYNYNYGENTKTPRLLRKQSNSTNYPGVRVVEDTDSPVKNLFGYKHEVYKGTQTGWQSVINNAPYIFDANTTSMSIGFWLKDSELRDIFNTNSLDFGLYFYADGSHSFNASIKPKLLADNIGVSKNVTLTSSTNTFESVTVTAVCTETALGYDHIRVDFKDIVFVEGYPFSTLCPNQKLYWQFDNVRSRLSNKQLTFAGVTIIRNAEIISGRYRYPDENGLSQIPQEGILPELLNGDSGGTSGMLVSYTEGAMEDLKVTSYVGDIKITNKMVSLYNQYEYNSTVRPASCTLTIGSSNYAVHESEDDGCPVCLGSGYIAGGHGYNRGKRITVTAHGKGYEDITSEWIDAGGRKWYIVRIVDENTLEMLGEKDANSGNDYDCIDTITSPLTHSQGATHTDNIAFTSVTTFQYEPVSMNNYKAILLNGVTPVTETGVYNCDFVDIVNEYDVVNPATIITALIENMPEGGYTENPEPNIGESFMHVSNVYRYLKDGTLLTISTLDNNTKLDLDYWGATQYAEKTTKTIFGGTYKKYIPDTLPKTENNVTYDFRTLVDMTTWTAGLYFTKSYWENADYPPDRCVTLFTNGSNVIQKGYVVGYLPIGLGDSAVRKDNTSTAVHIHTSRKYYPQLISGTIPAYTSMQSVCYRKPILETNNGYTDYYYVPYGDECYLYIDYHATGENRIPVPVEYVGKPMTVIHQTEGISVYGSIATNEIRVRCTAVNPNACAVVKIG